LTASTVDPGPRTYVASSSSMSAATASVRGRMRERYEYDAKPARRQ
jgi:hypothetical protein